MVEFECEEHHVTGYFSYAFLNALVEAGDFRVAHIAGMQKASVAHEPREDLVDSLVFGDGIN